MGAHCSLSLCPFFLLCPLSVIFFFFFLLFSFLSSLSFCLSFSLSEGQEFNLAMLTQQYLCKIANAVPLKRSSAEIGWAENVAVIHQKSPETRNTIHIHAHHWICSCPEYEALLQDDEEHDGACRYIAHFTACNLPYIMKGTLAINSHWTVKRGLMGGV